MFYFNSTERRVRAEVTDSSDSNTSRSFAEPQRKLQMQMSRQLYRFLLIAALVTAINSLPSSAEESVPLAEDFLEVPDELKLFQEMPLVITAARKPQRITEASSTIDLITAEDIKRSGALTLAEVLERLPGIYTPTAHNALDMLWIRGVGGRFNDNALLLIDGVPYRTLYYSNFPINEQIPLEDIKKIEIIRGPGSALYGTNAFTGVISVVTKDAVDIPKNEITASYGTWNTQNHYVSLAEEFETGEFTFFGKYLDTDGYKVNRNDEGFRTDERRVADNHAYKLKLRHKNLDLNIRYSKFSLNDSTAVPDEDEEGGPTVREHILTQLGYHVDLNPKLSLQVKAYFNHFALDRGRVAVDQNSAVISTNRSEIYGRVAGVDVLSTLRLSPTHTMLFGVNYEYEYLDHAFSETAEPPTAPFSLTEWASASGGTTPEAIDNNTIGVYFEDELKLGEYVILTSGLRLDSSETSETRLSPRVSIVYIPDNKTSIKLRYSEAFRAPTYQELYKQTNDGEAEGNKNLNPQTIKTVEFELSRFIWNNHRLNTTFFYTQFENFIKVIGSGDFQNLGKRELHGVEVGLHGRIDKDLSYFANYSLTNAKESNGADIGGVPENMGNLGVTYTGLDFMEVVPHLRWVGVRNRPLDYQGDVPVENRRYRLHGYATMNLTLLFKRLPGPMTASLSIRNLFNTTYHTPGEQTQDFDILQPGRRILFSLSTEF